jgi:hypothetical protein
MCNIFLEYCIRSTDSAISLVNASGIFTRYPESFDHDISSLLPSTNSGHFHMLLAVFLTDHFIFPQLAAGPINTQARANSTGIMT